MAKEQRRIVLSIHYTSPFLFRLLPLIFMVTLCHSVQAKPLTTASEYYEDAAIQMSENNAAEAEIQLKNALQLDEDHLPSQILLGVLYLKLGENQRAELELVKARNWGADPNLIAIPLAQAMLNLQKYSKLERYIAQKNRSAKVESKLNILLGAAYLALNRQDDAMAAYVEAERLNPTSILPLMSQLNMALGKSELSTANALLVRLRQMEPNNTDVLMKEAQVSHYSGDIATALANYDKILKINPEHVNARVARAGLLQAREGDHEWVIAELKPIMDENADLLNPEITFIYASSLLKLGKVDEARKRTQIARQRLNFLGPDILNQYPSLLFLDVSLAIFSGDLAKARESAERLLRITPSNSGSRMLLGQLYLEMKEGAQALLALEPLYISRAKDPIFLMLYGRALYQTGNPNDALYELERALALGNTNRQIHVTLGLVRRQLGQLDSAISGLELAVDHYPDDVGIGLLLIDLYLEKKDSVSAENLANSMRKSQPTDHRVYDYLGRISMLRTEVEEAIRYFKQSIELGPDYTEAQINLARTYILIGELDRAEQTLQKTLEIDGSHHDAMIAMAEISDKKGQVRTAIRWLERLNRLSPDKISEVLMLNRLYRREHMYPEALRLVEKLFEKFPADFALLVALLETQIQAQKIEAAVVQLNSSLKFSTDFSSGQLLKLASLQQDVGDLKGASLTLEKSIYLDPDFVQAKTALIKILTDMRKFDKAVIHINALKEKYPDKNIAYGLLGDIAFEKGQLEQALAYFKQANAKEPSTAAIKKIYSIEKQLSGAEKAITGLQQWIEQYPDDWNAQYAYALALIDVHEFEKSLLIHQKLLTQKSDNPLLMNNIAWLLQVTGSPAAQDYIAKAYLLYPENAAILDTYGWILTLQNKADLGVGYLRQALSRNSENPSIQYHLALALTKLGRTDEASQLLEELLKLKVPFWEQADAERLFQQLEKS